jgi:hypothetical protein
MHIIAISDLQGSIVVMACQPLLLTATCFPAAIANQPLLLTATCFPAAIASLFLWQVQSCSTFRLTKLCASVFMWLTAELGSSSVVQALPSS